VPIRPDHVGFGGEAEASIAACSRKFFDSGANYPHSEKGKVTVPSIVAIFGYLLAFGAGVSFVFQQAVNANLRVEVGSPWWAGFVSYLGGTLAMLLMAVLLLQPCPSMQMIYRSHWLSWTGGVFGAIYIAISILLLPRLGAATVIALIVAGQMIGSLAFDQFGLLGVPVHPLNMFRIVGAALLISGAILVRL
jgi:bacterial/archaeal transporter family-2 protein